jgi:hypothetical protein
METVEGSSILELGCKCRGAGMNQKNYNQTLLLERIQIASRAINTKIKDLGCLN